MQAFACGVCGAPLYFENSRCGRCGTAARFHRAGATLVSLPADRHVDAAGLVWTSCANLGVVGCNWLAPVWNWGPPALCFSCALTRTRPADADFPGMAAFRVAEFAKRRLVYSLDRLGLPIYPRDTSPTGLVFDLLSSQQEQVVTGHHNGLITVDLAESDDAHREGLRVSMAEPYRTLLGHFRHEIGHYYWALLVGGTVHVDGFRALFGDERMSYEEAMATHYAHPLQAGPAQAGSDDSWRRDYVSRYATMHPWEDFAEVFAHFLHITDTLQTAQAYGVATEGARPGEEFADLVSRVWLPLTVGLNQINRSMGKDDLYPFVLHPTVIEKLCWVAGLIRLGGDLMTGEPTYLELGVGDTAAARRFYGELLGWQPSGETGNGSLDTSTLAVGLHGDDPAPGFLVFLGVADLDAALLTLDRLGGRSDGAVHEAPGFGRYALCVDDQGVRFGLHQPERA